MKKAMNETLTKQEAKKIILFNEYGMAHTFYNMNFGLVGGDHSKESLFEDIDKSFICKKTGVQALGMGHGMVIVPEEKCGHSELLFVETKPLFNKKELKKLK